MHVEIGLGHLAHHDHIRDQNLRHDLRALRIPGDQHVDVHDHLKIDLVLGLVDPRRHHIVLKLHMRGGQHDDLHRDAGAPAHQQAHAREIPEGDADLQRAVFRGVNHPVQYLGRQRVDMRHVATDGGNFPRFVFFQTHEALPVIVLFRHHPGDDGVDLRGHDIAGVGDGDAAGDMIEKHRRA